MKKNTSTNGTTSTTTAKAFEESKVYLTGKMYADYGSLLMNPKTTIEDLSDFGKKYDLDLDVVLRSLSIEAPKESAQ